MKHAWTRSEAWGKGTAAFFGGLLVFGAFLLFAGAALPRLGLGASLSLALGAGLCVPLWAGAMTVALLARSGARAWLLVGGAALALAALAGAFFLL